MNHRTRAFLALILLLMALGGTRSLAHPLGNFTINHLARITATGDALQVRYILDIAEIPTFQIMHQPGGGNWSANDMRAWAENESSIVQSGLQISVDGRPVPLRVMLARAALRPGAGGLPIIRWVGVFNGSIATGVVHHITITDNVYSDRRIGWKDIVVGLQREPTNELRRYPSALLGTPRRVNTAAFTLEPNANISHVSEGVDGRPVSGTVSSWISPTALSDMFSRPNQTPLFIALTLLAAFGLGALHAIEPGHGKALLAFTLVGARATTKQALILAWSLTVAHTAGVLLLGAVLFFTAGFVSESIYPWITLLSGIIIAVIGARALTAFFRTRALSAHLHLHEHHGAHPHPHEHHHSHDIPGSQPLNFRTAVWAAMSGGIAPCPAAIVVLLAALRLHEIGYGIALIIVFSMGLAGVLSGIGIGVVHGASWLSRQSAYARFAQYGPFVTSIVICTIGAWTVGIGLGQQGVSVPVPLLAVLSLAAIAGYAFSHTAHLHRHHAAATQLS